MIAVEDFTRRHRQMLLHCFLYYRLDETLIPDQTFDAWRRELAEWYTQYPEVAKQAPYYALCHQFKTSPSGFFIKDYPEDIVTVAFHVLYQLKVKQDSGLGFREFVSQYGYPVMGAH